MKSAYELAMERLEKADPSASVSLTDEQRQALAAVDEKYKAKIAEREVFLNRQLMDARQQRDREAVEQLETQLRNERLRLEDQREAEKDRIREAARQT
jgi:cation diffusion facilitator CzcD-associated flavoprotein CzcO